MSLVASEIVTSCLASRSGPEELFTGIQGRNPQVRFHDNDNAGYTLLDIDAERIDGRFRAVRDLTDPNSASFDLRRFAIEDRAPGVRI
jgi:alkaline phosphatase D|tara:strand:- start:10 stop:273 length:264 start_codon:yes stop_codon:yes gene_type:complete